MSSTALLHTAGLFIRPGGALVDTAESREPAIALIHAHQYLFENEEHFTEFIGSAVVARNLRFDTTLIWAQTW